MHFTEGCVTIQCMILANCFKFSVKAGYDSKDFCEKVMNSWLGVNVLTDQRMIEWSCDTYMFESFETDLKFKKSNNQYPEHIMEYAGYLYKYWISHRDADPREIYKIAPIDFIANGYGFYHTQDWDYVIDLILEQRGDLNSGKKEKAN